MQKIIETDEYGYQTLTPNNTLLLSVLKGLANNNTSFPDIVDIYNFKKEVKLNEKDEDGKRRRETREAMRVYFSDGTWTDVVKSNEDKDDPVTGLLYAIVKRLFGTPTEGGYVNGCGFMTKLKKLISNARSEEKEAEEKKARIAKKQEEDKKAHEEAEYRRERNPSIGLRIKNLEDKFEKFLDLFSNKGSMTSDK